ncbi:MAG: hypothetical protein IIZ16_01950, partial [Selenomonas sp.]|nr:hypothetical protein [Selenomonas sp.]
ENLQVELPLPTRILLSTAAFLRDYGDMTLVIVILGLLVILALRKSTKVKLYYERCHLALPLLGSLRLHTDWMLAL